MERAPRGHSIAETLEHGRRYIELTARDAARGVTYVYFQVADAWAFDTAECFELAVEQRAPARARVRVQYDSTDARAPLAGAYRDAGALASEAGRWTRGALHLHRARFANRENAGGDLRLCVEGEDVLVRRVELRRVACEERE